MKSQRGFWKFLTDLAKKFRKEVTEEIKDFDQVSEQTVQEQYQTAPESVAKKSEPKATSPIRRRKEPVFIQVGLDFGTSSTKIVYRQLGGRQALPLMFGHELSNYPSFCLPSVAAINDQKQLLLGVEAARLLENEPWDSGLRRLKVVVAGKYDSAFRDESSEDAFYMYIRERLGDSDSLSPETITAVYLADAMRLIRRKLSYLPEYRNQELDIGFNICIPIDHVQNNQVCPVFLKILAWAEIIERKWTNESDGFNPLVFAQEVESEADYGPADGFTRSDQDSRVFAVPEAVAESASYLTSLQRQEGIHAIVDLGAGTTDVSIFNLKDEAHDMKPYWYAAGNIPKGCNNIEKVIANDLAIRHKSYSARAVTEALLSLDGQELPQNSGSLYRGIRHELEQIHRSTYRVWAAAYKRRRLESHWYEVQVFMSGGGANTPHVEDVFRVPWWQQLQSRFITYPVRRLPEPEDYNSINGQAPFQRLAVAYGLSRPIPELGDFVLPSDCPDQTPPPLPVRTRTDGWDGSGLNPTPEWLGR